MKISKLKEMRFSRKILGVCVLKQKPENGIGIIALLSGT
jgi:hypothetical protein